jgi:hypothetical protein
MAPAAEASTELSASSSTIWLQVNVLVHIVHDVAHEYEPNVTGLGLD